MAEPGRRLNRSQRVVIVVAWGVVLLLIGGLLTRARVFGDTYGWVAYAPLSNGTTPIPRTHVLLRALLYFVLILLWVGPSVYLLRTRRDDE